MQKLEASKLFPLIAWTCIIGFSVFTYYLIIDLENTNSNIGQKTIYIENAVENPKNI